MLARAMVASCTFNVWMAVIKHLVGCLACQIWAVARRRLQKTVTFIRNRRANTKGFLEGASVLCQDRKIHKLLVVSGLQLKFHLRRMRVLYISSSTGTNKFDRTSIKSVCTCSKSLWRPSIQYQNYILSCARSGSPERLRAVYNPTFLRMPFHALFRAFRSFSCSSPADENLAKPAHIYQYHPFVQPAVRL